ncbi:hypothetical protein TRAPUB_8506 [Trametes pubescens]|uniref:Uncharacterized protein n=1 Tax=Trametes pubescens TaxID=154538 RepID=A0A1M2W547_TRAPU|nr:hypothetical protein TRAPUB_8506 [Trametes pubescens]
MQILERSINALELAKLVTAGLPVPGLSLVLDSALSIAKKAKEVEDTRDDCRALAERAATLVLAVYQQLKNGSGETAAKEHVTTFLQNLQDIENLMARRLRARQRGRFMFVIKHGKIAKEVKALTAKLDESYRHFLIQTALVVDQSLNTLTSGNIRMMRHIDDSARVGEVVLGETRVIRTGISDLADRVGGNLIFDGTIFKPLELHYFFVPSRSWRRSWEKIANCPRYPLGVWLGRKTACEDWTVLSARNPELKTGATKAQRVPQVLPGPRQGESPPGTLIEKFRQLTYDDKDYRNFEQRFSMARLLDIPKSDEAEMRVEFDLGTGENQTRWSRYKLSCVPVDTTLVFLQRVHALHGFSEAASRMARFLPDPSVTARYACIGMATHRFYYTETTITMSTRAAAQGVPPLWFFLLQFDGGESSAHGRNIPCGFWSLKKYPTSVPAGVIFDPTPQFEPIRKGEEAPLLTSTQILGDLVFTTETKMSTTFLQLSEDELLTLRELQESLRSTTSLGDASRDSDDSGANGFATHNNSDEDNNGDGTLESSGSDNSPATAVHSESTDPDYQDMTDSEYDGTEEYYSAEEY